MPMTWRRRRKALSPSAPGSPPGILAPCSRSGFRWFGISIPTGTRRSGPRTTRAERRRERRALQGKEPRRKKQLYLEILEPEKRRGQAFDLDDELTVGRSPGCGVSTVDDVYTSTLHARLFRHGDQLWVEDLGSTNGTFVNSERISVATRLGKGDLLQVGGTVFEVTK